MSHDGHKISERRSETRIEGVLFSVYTQRFCETCGIGLRDRFTRVPQDGLRRQYTKCEICERPIQWGAVCGHCAAEAREESR